MTTVVLTGGAGKLGRAAARDLLEHGYEVVVLDQRVQDLPADLTGRVHVVPIDLGSYGDVLDVMFGVQERYDHVDAVVHLAAIPAPGLRPDHHTFTHNMTATFNVFSAARRAGVRKIVWASSETVLGLPFDTPPPYVPVDEEYHPRPESTYSLTKTLEEELAHQLCRWDTGLSMIGLRFSNVMDPEDYAAFPSFDADATLRKWNLWGYIDARDGAQAIRRGLEHGGTGQEVFVIANADTVMSRPNDELLAEVFPGVEVRKKVGANETLLSIDKARRVLGFEPEHSWRDEVG